MWPRPPFMLAPLVSLGLGEAAVPQKAGKDKNFCSCFSTLQVLLIAHFVVSATEFSLRKGHAKHYLLQFAVGWTDIEREFEINEIKL